MKTTLDINDQLLANAKALAAHQRTSLTRLIEEGLQMRLQAQVAPQRGKLHLPVFKGRRLRRPLEVRPSWSVLQGSSERGAGNEWLTGLSGAVYRALVIGSSGHRIVVKRMLDGIWRDAIHSEARAASSPLD